MQDKWCPENDGAWRDEQAELQRLMVERLIQPYIDKIDGLKHKVRELERTCMTEFDALTDEDYSEWVDVAGRNKIKELQEQVHSCDECGEYCKLCTCWDLNTRKMEDQLEIIGMELEHVQCEEWCGKSPTTMDDGRCHICRIKEILKDNDEI